jgi:hypothetical protein
MPYWTLNKESNVGEIHANLLSVQIAFNIPRHTLYEVFSRKKLKEFENDKVRIIKCYPVALNKKEGK